MPKHEENISLDVDDVIARVHLISSLLADNAIPFGVLTMLALTHMLVCYNLTLSEDPKDVVGNILNMVKVSGDLAGWDDLSKSSVVQFKTKSVM